MAKAFPPAILLMGPTASGKTGVAIELAQRLNGEIVSVDSALVYRDMNIGTAKPDAATLSRAPHHLIDLIDPTQSYSAAQFRNDALKAMSGITARGKIPILAGGTMLYFKALMEGISALPQADPELRLEIEERAEKQGWPAMHTELSKLDPATAVRLQPTDSQRIQRALEVCYLTGAPMSQQFGERSAEDFAYDVLPIALLPSDRSELHRRINARFAAMLETGLIDEVQQLRKKYELTPTLPSMRAVGYRQVWDYLDGNFDRKELAARGMAATRQLAKRQLTWLRAMATLVVFDCFDKQLAARVADYVDHWLKAKSFRAE
jgi:tRNA dimethylallyltransferase